MKEECQVNTSVPKLTKKIKSIVQAINMHFCSKTVTLASNMCKNKQLLHRTICKQFKGRDFENTIFLYTSNTLFI